MTRIPPGQKDIQMQAMSARAPSRLLAWETTWTLFGPIPNEGDGRTWPGEIGFDTLPLDGAVAIPDEAQILGRGYAPQRVTSTDGRLFFPNIYGNQSGLPIVYMFTSVPAPKEGVMPVSFGANWGTQWWINGQEVFDSCVGNGADPELITGQQFLLPLEAGDNVVLVKVVAGTAEGWMITLARQEPVRATGRSRPRSLARPSVVPSPDAPPSAYTEAGLRIEQRPGPVPEETSVMREHAMAAHGVQAHWIGIVDPTGSPYADSEVLPPGEKAAPDGAELLRRQVDEIHGNGMAAMTWFPGVHSRSTARVHPDWRAVPLTGAGTGASASVDDLVTMKEASYQLCPNSPYGDALIAFVLESIERYGLDGFWFDGTSRAGGASPTCVCAHCAARFREAEGLDLPAREDWDDPVFRRWVAWRYRDYMEYWGRLAHAVRQRFPQARIVVNHLHRLCHNWYTGMPVDAHDADVVAGSEAQDDPFVSAFHSRQQRAYGRAHAEVWMGLHKLFTKRPSWPDEMEPVDRYMHHALCCMTAGTMPSFGTPDPAEKLTRAYDLLAEQVNPRRPFVGGEPVPYAALLLSQQAETFRFSRRADKGFPRDYWYTVLGWHHLLMEKQLPQEVIFDHVLASGRLASYPVVIAPHAVALSDAQVEALLTYVQGGGVLACTPDLGACDAWGEPADPERVTGLLGQPGAAPPDPDASLQNSASDGVERTVGSGRVIMPAGNVGLRFLQARSAALADEVAALLRDGAPPPLEIDGPRRLHAGLFRSESGYVLHLQNFIAYSEAETFPNPVLTCPEPTGEICVRVRGFPVRRAVRPLVDGCPELDITQGSEECEFRIPGIAWGAVVVLEAGGESS